MSFKKTLKSNIPDNKYTVPRRAVGFIVRIFSVIIIVAILAFTAFLTAMHSANIYILVTEGITLRAKCILGQGELTEMEQYFTDEFIKSDKAFQDNVYENYSITGFDYRLNVDKISLWPWSKTASMTVTERIPSITGTAYESAPSSAIPAWEDVQYKVVCIKENNRWYISKVTAIGKPKPDAPKATPNMSLTPIVITPSPTQAPITTDMLPSSGSGTT